MVRMLVSFLIGCFKFGGKSGLGWVSGLLSGDGQFGGDI